MLTIAVILAISPFILDQCSDNKIPAETMWETHPAVFTI